MDNSLLIQYLTIGISILALISSVLIGVNQVKISKLQTDMQNKVELYLLSEPITLRKADGTVQDKIVPGIIIRNIGKSIKKINDLQNENEKLKAKINALSTQAPQGSDALSQGDDLFEIEFSFTIYYEDFDDEIEYTRKDEFTWNEIFSSIGPHLVEENDEDEIIDKIEGMIAKKQFWRKNIEKDTEAEMYSLSIDQDIGITILMQFRALGLICLSNNRKSYTKRFWKLTPYGDSKLMGIMAIKKHE